MIYTCYLFTCLKFETFLFFPLDDLWIGPLVFLHDLIFMFQESDFILKTLYTSSL